MRNRENIYVWSLLISGDLYRVRNNPIASLSPRFNGAACLVCTGPSIEIYRVNVRDYGQKPPVIGGAFGLRCRHFRANFGRWSQLARYASPPMAERQVSGQTGDRAIDAIRCMATSGAFPEAGRWICAAAALDLLVIR